MVCSEVAILVTNVLECPRHRVYDLDVACKISFPIDFTETIECLVRDVDNIKFMVA